jgi:hypothetical protein
MDTCVTPSYMPFGRQQPTRFLRNELRVCPREALFISATHLRFHIARSCVPLPSSAMAAIPSVVTAWAIEQAALSDHSFNTDRGEALTSLPRFWSTIQSLSGGCFVLRRVQVQRVAFVSYAPQGTLNDCIYTFTPHQEDRLFVYFSVYNNTTWQTVETLRLSHATSHTQS